MRPYPERLDALARARGTLLCIGLDPDPARIEGTGVKAAESFLNGLLDKLDKAGARPAAFKPNLAYFEQYGSAGLALLERLLDRLRDEIVILDGKRGDIGRSSAAYARALFETWQADAATVSPWMGQDSVEPFLAHCPDRGVYLLLRTSNPGHEDIQRTVWENLAGKIKQWARPGTGAVVGATNPEHLARAVRLLKELPLLIPGVGAQGGTAAEVMRALGEASNAWLHRVNVSSAILYAPDPVEAARRFAEQLTPER